MLRNLVRAGAIVALFAGPAAAQIGQTSPGSSTPGSSGLGIPLNGVEKPKTPEEIEKQKAADRAYEAAMKKIPDKPASSDPWGDVRPPATAKNKQQPQ